MRRGWGAAAAVVRSKMFTPLRENATEEGTAHDAQYLAALVTPCSSR